VARERETEREQRSRVVEYMLVREWIEMSQEINTELEKYFDVCDTGCCIPHAEIP